MTTAQIITIVAVVLILGIIIFPLVNRRQFRNLEPDQQIRLIMKEAKGLVYFKNVSNGSTGVLFYVKNKGKYLHCLGCLTVEICLYKGKPFFKLGLSGRKATY